MTEYVLIKRIPTIKEYLAIRRAIGLGDLDEAAIQVGLSKSLFSVCVLFKDNVVGFGRVIGDEGIYYYIQDVFIHPEHQRKGNGRRVMDAIIDYFAASVCKGATIGLMAAPGVSGFYEQYSFEKRRPDGPGMYKIW